MFEIHTPSFTTTGSVSPSTTISSAWLRGTDRLSVTFGAAFRRLLDQGGGGSGREGLVEVFSDLVEEVIDDVVCLGEALRGAVEGVEGVVEEHGV